MATKRPQVDESNGNISPSQNTYSFGRFAFCYALFALLALALVAQSFNLQILDSSKLIEEANKRSLRTEQLPFTRGKILDRNGRILSMSVPMHSITIDPKVYFDHKLVKDKARWKKLSQELGISDSKMQEKVKSFVAKKWQGDGKKYDPRAVFNIKSDDYWHLLARTSGVDYAELSKVRNNPHSEFLQLEYEAIRFETEKLQAMAKQLELKYNDLLELLYKRSSERFAYIARHKTEQIGNYIRALKIEGIVIKVEPRSFYPMKEKAAQLIGYTNKDGYGRSLAGNQDNGAGLEYSFDQFLTGENGKRTYQKDAKGNIINVLREEKQYDPQDLVLSIDENIQSVAYQEIQHAVKMHKAESGTAVLVDIQTGEILAMATAPSFNPNDPQRKNFASEFARNRAVTDTFEPGSTVKPFVVLTALQHRVVNLDSVIDTKPFVANNSVVQDSSYHASLDLTGILQKSSNVGVARLTQRLPSVALLIDTYSKVGFGKPIGLGLGAEAKGTNGERKKWSDIEQASISYGYSINVTPVQLVRAYATLGSFGIYRPLSITKVDPPVIGERVLPEKISREVVRMMESVAQKGGTGVDGAIDGYRIAVKTGTADKVEEDVEQSKLQGKKVMKYAKNKSVAFMAGIAPASNPRFALVVLVDEPRAGLSSGGKVSGPVFSRIMHHTLKTYQIAPDAL